VFIGLLSTETILKTTSKFDLCIDIESDKQTLIRQLDELFEKNFGDHKTQHNNTLSERENSILALVARGLTNNDIGAKLFISTHTVMTHRKNITRKLGIKTVAGLTVYAIINKLIKAEEL
jgi:DNA-binding NarL/FixJ family response regulator